jgi:pyruvate/oxaloacetate carboxyltransferase
VVYDALGEEDVLSYIALPQVAETFFEKRRAMEEKKCKYSIEKIGD